MTTAPATPGFTKTVNAVVIRSSVLFPAVEKTNKIKASVHLKINQNSPLQETAFLSYSNHRRASNPTKERLSMSTKIERKEWAVNTAESLREQAPELSERLEKRANELAAKLEAEADTMDDARLRSLEAEMRVLQDDCREAARE